ncbi:MAG: response regulator [Opitutae bacterium]|nr:response regulator [Opitutae bacterium]
MPSASRSWSKSLLQAGVDLLRGRKWAQTVEAGGRLARLTLWTGLGLGAVTLLLALWGRHYVFARIESTYLEVQRRTSADQARRIAQLLEQELAAGVAAPTVQRHLQEGLSRNPYDETGFLCLLDEQATVLCHPDPGVLGMKVPFASTAMVAGGGPGAGEWIVGQNYAGDTHLVVRHAVKGAPWQVSVHANYRATQQRVGALRHQVTLAALPIFVGFIVLGTIAARLVGRRYERCIEEANHSLEQKVQQRTAELAHTSVYFRQIIDAAPSALFICDTGGGIRSANQHALRLTARPLAEIIGLQIDTLWRWVESPAGRAKPVNGDGLRIREAKLAPGGGAMRDLQVFTRVIQLAAEQEALFVVQDVTELKTLEREFLQAQKMEAVGQLAGGVAHDFNNLLAAIMGFAEIARLQSSEPAVRERLDQAVAACRRAGQLSQQLLAFSRKQVLEPQVARLPELIDEGRKVLERVLGEGIGITAEHGTAPWSLHIDPTQFEQTLLNLAINARDAMSGQGRLYLRSRNVPAGSESGDNNRCLLSDCVCLEVEDTGPGIAPEIQDRIFEPFFTTKEVGRGTGLGLASVQGIVQQHGGHIELRSAPGQGARFSLYFPRYVGPPESTDESEAPASAAVSRQQRLLVVEDEPALLESLCGLLEARGYLCTGCTEREAALEWLSRGLPFDAVLSDVVMPGMSLAEFLRRVADTGTPPRLVLMTGYASGQSLDAAEAARVPVLRKPFSIDQLSTLLTAPATSAPQIGSPGNGG